MCAQIKLIETLVRYCDPEQDFFDLHGEMLDITTEDIYFIMFLSHRGVPMNLIGSSRGHDPLSVQDYVNTYFLPGSQNSGTQVLIG